MSLFAYLDGVLVGTTSIRLRANGEEGIIGLPVAADGSGSIGNILFDDPTGALSVTGWQIVKVNEADCISAPTLFYGCVADRTYRRGKYRQGAGREIDTSIVDSNTFLSCRIVTGGSANRPSETQATRLAWLLASDAVADPAGGPPMFSNLGLVNGTTKVLDAANYRGQYPAEVLNDLCTSRQEIFFTYWDQALQKVGLFFDVPTATAFTCTLSVSNVLSDTGDVDNPSTTCFPPYLDGELVVDPQDVYTTGSMVYTGGTEYAINSATYSFFDAPSPILTRSFRVENDKVGRATTAHALLVLMLAADASERTTLKFTVRLPSTKVGLVQAGMRIQCRFSHLPGFTSFAYTRIERLNYIPVDGDPTHYDVSVECSTHGLSTGIGSGGGSTDPFPYVPPPATASIVQQASGAGAITMASAVAQGDTLVLVLDSRGSRTYNFPLHGYTFVQEQAMTGSSGNETFCYYKQADGTEGTTINFSDDHIGGTWYELPGLWTPDTMDTSFGAGSPHSVGPITAVTGSITFTACAYGQGGAYDSGAAGFSFAPGSGWTEDYDAATPSGGAPNVWVAHRTDAGSLTGSAMISAPAAPVDAFGVGTTNWAAQIVSFTSSAPAAAPPQTGKPWGPVLPNETPNGTTTAFTMPSGYTWAEGSLKVFVDRLDQTAAVTAEDGAAGTFTLGFAPKTGWLVEVYGVEI